MRIRIPLLLALFLAAFAAAAFALSRVRAPSAAPPAPVASAGLSEPEIPAELQLFARCYPDVDFFAKWDAARADWQLTVFAPAVPGGAEKKSAEFFWADGRVLPEAELSRRDDWWPLLYHYDKALRDPAQFSDEEIARMKSFGSAESRQNAAGSPMFFFDFLYSADSQRDIEAHIVRTTFLGKPTRVHERIEAPLRRVESHVNALAKTDPAVRAFVTELKSADAYYWRQIAGTSRKSFHSYGIAVDVLPVRYGGREVYWSWAKERRGENWMLTPLSERWMPPAPVVAAFEQEGFIWGGKWAIWDNMHFEYHPELIAHNGITGG